MYRQRLAVVMAALWASHSVDAAALVIQFDYRFDEAAGAANFFGSAASPDAVRRARLEDAAQVFEDFIADDLLPIQPGGGNTWTAVFSNPNTGAATNLVDLVIPADTVRVFVGARMLGGNTLGIAGPGGFSAMGFGSFPNDVETRGEIGAPGSDFGPWGGSAAFDVDSAWHFGAGLPGFGMNDFFSVAVHELAHVLGFGTSTSWANQVFDVDPGVCGGGLQFQGSASGSVCLEDRGHWEDGTLSLANGVPQEVSMDTDLTTGDRKLFTDLDFAGLQDVGWVPVPEAATALLFAVGALGLAYFRRSTSRSRSA